ncbi:MAG: type II secretion system protein GspG [Prosthecobacter sp.]|nr:type II secretion system protein GspG [Prosthecobacter sp.]
MKIHHTPHTRLRNAFTLMEMMLVLGIIALLITVVASISPMFIESAEITTAQAKIGTLKSMMQAYKNNNRRFPASLEDLVKPPANAQFKKQYVSEEGITDPWGEKFQLRSPGKKDGAPFEVYSMGPDKRDGTDDDVY